MTARDGDGWVQCDGGNKHWGRHGAAGLLLIRGNEILLQHRAPWVHSGDTWGIPGGARDSHESMEEAAIREAVEELGIDPTLVTPIQHFLDDHSVWSYTTVIASADNNLVAHELNEESERVEWVAREVVHTMNLHPSFAASWPALLALLAELGI
jgi:8-oxo-dGTP diphosphatase